MAKTVTFGQQLKQRMQIQRAFNYIHEDPNRPTTINDLSEIACYSPFHFQRLYSEMLGETWSQTLCRSRLYKAAQRLMTSTEGIGDIAFEAGFETPVGFGKAFKKYFNCTPGYYRSEFMGDVFIPGIACHKKRRSKIAPVAIVKLSSQYVYTARGYGCRAGRFDRSGLSAFHRLVDKHHQHLAYGGLYSRWLGVIPSYRNFFEGDKAEYIAAVTVPEVGADKSLDDCLYLHRGDYAQFEHIGPLNEQTINSAIYDWLPSSGYTLDQFRPILVDFGQMNLLQYLPKFQKENNGALAYQHLELSESLLQHSKLKIYIPLQSTPELERLATISLN